MNAKTVTLSAVLLAMVLVAMFGFGGGSDVATPSKAPGSEGVSGSAGANPEAARGSLTPSTQRTEAPVEPQSKAAAGSGAETPPADGATIRGIVVDASRAAVAGARIRAFRDGESIGSKRVYTGADGRFVLSNVPAGEVTVHASEDKRGKGSQTVTAVLGTTVPVEIELSRGFVLHGRVLTQSDEPVSGCRITCSWPGTNKLTTADEHGRFEIANCAEQLVSFRVEGPGIVRLHESGVDPRAGDVELRVQALAKPSATITGVVHDAHGQPLAGLDVLAGRAGQSVTERINAATEPDGRFRFGPLVPGDWYLMIHKEGHPELSEGPVTIVADAVRDVGVLRVTAGGSLQATIRGSDPAGVRFRARRVDGKSSGGSLVRDERMLTGTPMHPGNYNLLVTGEGTGAQTIAFAIAAAQVTRLDVTLQRGIEQRFEIGVPGRAPTGSRVMLQVRRDGNLVLEKLVTRASGAPAPPRKTKVDLAPGDYTATVICDAMKVVEPFSVGAAPGPAVAVRLQ